jgi:hypothetical protein
MEASKFPSKTLFSEGKIIFHPENWEFLYNAYNGIFVENLKGVSNLGTLVSYYKAHYGNKVEIGAEFGEILYKKLVKTAETNYQFREYGYLLTYQCYLFYLHDQRKFGKFVRFLHTLLVVDSR